MISQAAIDVIQECSRSSFEDMPFPEVVRKLGSVGVESYHADLFRHEKTYSMPNGDSYCQPEEERYASGLSASLVTPELNADAVKGAVAQIQQRKIGYLEFLKQIMKAGVSSYSVYLRGRRAVYVGRTGDEYVEWFPGAR